jgi:hypothetical protein
VGSPGQSAGNRPSPGHGAPGPAAASPAGLRAVDRPSLLFRETMTGPFQLGETDPASGAAAGRLAGTSLELAATVRIDDVSRFARDPQHVGRLEGHLCFGPLGAGLAAGLGVVRLFVPADAPGHKLMVYELCVAAGDRRLCLAGRKLVARSLLNAWHDTTTLVCRLHEGSNPQGRVVGAGILTLSAWAFLRQLGSFRTPRTASAVRSARAVWTFGRFFAGELLESYVR